MNAIRFMAALAMLAVLAVVGVSQARGQGKVYTNEDISRPAAEGPSAEEQSSAASAQQAPSEGAVPQAASSPADASQAPSSDYQRAMEFQQVLRQNLQELQGKMAAETNEARKTRWTAMVECVEELLQRNQDTINELSSEMQMNSGPGPAGS